MKLVTSRGIEIPLKNSSRPKFNSHRGRTWDVPTIFYIEGTKVEPHYDSTWGFRFYFEYQNKWYSGDALQLDTIRYNEKCELHRGK